MLWHERDGLPSSVTVTGSPWSQDRAEQAIEDVQWKCRLASAAEPKR
jgi:hypothetical protein